MYVEVRKKKLSRRSFWFRSISSAVDPWTVIPDISNTFGGHLAERQHELELGFSWNHKFIT
jgi:hypothetical protein